MMSSLVMNNILRYEGKASFAMIGLVTGGLLNIALDPLFIFGLGMGTAGAGPVSYTHLDVYKRQDEGDRRKDGRAHQRSLPGADPGRA